MLCANDCEVHVSPITDTASVERMGVALDRPIITGQFNTDQQHFLDYHRNRILLKSAI